MTAATLSRRPRRPSRLLGSTTLELILRVLNGEYEGREIRIRSPKCTIGSAQGCTLRLVARGIRPLHCWILRGIGGTIVRRRDGNTRLNGRPFQDAPLTPGDRLQIGPIELEVCQCPIVPLEWTLESAELPESASGSDSEYAAANLAVIESAQAAKRLQDELHSLERTAAQQLGELNDLMSRVAAERDDLSERLAQVEAKSASERDRLSLRLRTLEAEAASERDALHLERQQLELSLAVNQQQLDELRRHQGSREAEIESVLHAESRRVAEVQDRLEQAVRERASVEALWQQQTVSLRADSEARQAECDRLQDECQGLETQLAQLRELVGYTAAERDNLTVQLDGRQRHLTDHEQQLAQEKADLQHRLETALAQLAEADRRSAALHMEGDNRLRTEAEQAGVLQQRLEETLADKGELERRLDEQTAAWHAERESLRQQTERVTNHCKQVEGQLTHVRDLVESLASDRDSLCQQLEATEIKLATEQQQWQEQRASWEQQSRGLSEQDGNRQHMHDELSARVEAEIARAEHWQRRADEAEQQLAAASQQVTEATERFTALRSESEGRLHDESGRTAQLAQEAEQTREQLSVTQVALADAETRLVAIQTEIEHRLRTEQERTTAAEQQAAELSRELAATDVRLAEAERRLSAFRIEGDGRLNAESQKSLECERKLTEACEELTVLREQVARGESQIISLQAELDAQQAAQRQAKESTAARWEMLQQQLAASDSRLADAQAEFEQRLRVEVEKSNDFQHQVAEIHRELDAAGQLRLEVEQRLADVETQHAMQIATEHQRASDLERRVNESEASCADIEMRLLRQAEAMLLERESWNTDRERLHQECRRLGHGLIEKQQELDDLAERIRAAEAAPSPGPMTVPFGEIEQAIHPSDPIEDERTSWNTDRERLEQRVAELQQQLMDQKQFSQGMTLGSEAIAELRSQSQAEKAIADLDELRTHMAAMQGELADALAWRDRFQAADEQLQQQRSADQSLAEKVEQLQQQLTAVEQAALVNSQPSEPSADDRPEGGQLSELQAFHDQQQADLADDRRRMAEERTFLEAARQELDRDRDEFKQSQSEFETQWRKWEESLRTKEELLNNQAEELADRLERAAVRQAEMEIERANLAQQSATFNQRMVAMDNREAQLRAVEPTLEQPAAQLEREMPKDSIESGGLATAQPLASQFSGDGERSVQPAMNDAAVPQPAAEAAINDGQNADASSVLDRSATATSSERPKPVWTQPDLPARPADDDSIEAYMARLLKRVRGDAPPPPHPFSPPATPNPTPAVTVEHNSSHSASATIETPIQPDQATKPEEFMPRNRAPELTANYAAMRELANSAARTAIVKHQRKSGSELALAQSVGALLTLFFSCVTGYFAYRTQSLHAGIGAGIGGLAACYWGGRATRHAIKAILLRMPVVESLVQPAEGPDVDAGQAPDTAADATANLETAEASGDDQSAKPAGDDVAQPAANQA